ncbi:MAG: DUF6716 putative glycosyltransferase [Actinomycetes bacterium]
MSDVSAAAGHVTTRVLAVADSDSYLKWAAALLDDLPDRWERRLVVVRSPIAPTSRQVAAATTTTGRAGRPPPVVTTRALRRLAERYRPDALLLACTGPVVDLLANVTLTGLSRRPVLVSGLPGIAVPASARAWLYRSSVDLVVVHSLREVCDVTELGHALGAAGTVGLARLPFLSRSGAPGHGVRGEGSRDGPAGAGASRRDQVVFAVQSLVPARGEDRERVLRALAALAEQRPDLKVVVKLRSTDGEMQTHREHLPYRELWDGLVAAGDVRAGAVVFETGEMRGHLERAAGFVTVGSTAALEAIAMSVPLLVLSDFWVSDDLLNVAFEGSGCLGTLADLEKADFRVPDPGWCARNYFHDACAATWQDLLVGLLGEARAERLPEATSLLQDGASVSRRRRARLRLMVPPSLYRVAVRASRWCTRASRRVGRDLRRRPTRGTRTHENTPSRATAGVPPPDRGAP